jgi:6-phosphogluconolactonase
MVKTVWPNAEALSIAVAHLLVTESNAAVNKKGQFIMALSGGTTPKLLYQVLAQPPFVNNIPWQKTIILFGDERFVLHTNSESNFKMASDALLQHVPIPKKNIYAVATKNITPQQSAQQYHNNLRKIITAKNAIDVVLLGIGEEGHTASIFPNSPLLTDKKNWVSNIWLAEKNMERISLTLPFINLANNAIFLVSGANKATIVKKIFSKSGANLPAAKVKAAKNTFWFLDEAATENVS